MLALTDSELQIVTEAAKPLQPNQRSEFLQAVAVELGKFEVVGDGVIHRVTAKIQREHLTRPRYRTGIGRWS